MKAFRYLWRFGGLFAAMLATFAVTATTALARIMPPRPDDLPPVSAGGGMPGWEITLIAVGAALTAAILAVLADRAWSARRRPASAAQARGTAQAAVGRH
jgi:hypothetical protein